MAKHRGANRILWLFIPVVLVVVAVWFVVGFWGPQWIYPLKAEIPAEQSARGTLGDQFGAVNSLFAGLAFALLVLTIIYQARELAETVRAQTDSARAAEDSAKAQTRLAELQAETAKQQTNLLKTQVLLQLLDDIRSVDWGQAHQRLNAFVADHPDDFAVLFGKHRSEAGSEAFEVDKARRVFIEPCYKIWHVWQARIVDDDFAKAILDEVIVRTMLKVIEPLEGAIRQNYDDSMFRAAETLYDAETLEARGSFIKARE